MWIHVAKTVSSCFCALRQIRSIRRTVSKPVLLSLVVALVLARLVAPHSLVFQICYLASFSLCSTLLHDWRALVVRRPRYATAPWFALVAISGAHHVSSGCACQSVTTWSGTVLSVSWSSPRLPHRRQCCSFHARDSTDGDRAFPVAAACACNNLPTSVTSALSVYFQKETQNQTFYSPFFALTILCMYFVA